MLVSRILSELDAQLQRLQTARNTIASLNVPTPVDPGPALSQELPKRAVRVRPAEAPPQDSVTAPAAAVDVLSSAAAVAPEVAVAAVPTKRRGRPKGSVPQKSAAPRGRAQRSTEPTALARVLTTGPVFVSAAELERRRQQAVVMAPPRLEVPTAPEGSLEALIREVAERRTAA